MANRIQIASALLLIFFIGFGIIVYMGRPVVEIKKQLPNPTTTTTEQQREVSTDTPSITNTSNPDKDTLTFSMTEVQTHNIKENCWTTINKSVYDLTTWVSRHPGGAKPIVGLCGTDGSARFTKKHGSSPTAQKALGLLFMGILK